MEASNTVLQAIGLKYIEPVVVIVGIITAKKTEEYLEGTPFVQFN